MLLPEYLNIAGNQVRVLVLIAFVGFICWVFVTWCESRKDGFRCDKFFDLIFSSVICCSVVLYALYSIYDWLSVYRPGNFILALDKDIFLVVFSFLASLIPVLYFSKKWRWSVFRVLDIYTQAFGLLVLILALGKFLISGQGKYIILVSLLLSLYISVLKFRGYKFHSGFIFTTFLLFIGVVGLIFFRRKGYLLFYPLLFTIGMVNLYFRWKDNMPKKSLSKQFLINVKNKLLRRDKALEETQKDLITEDPYLQEGRAVGNAEVMDEAQEDIGKNITDAKMGIVTTIRYQIKRALAAINLGTYGICEVCGSKIDTARLKAYPEATTCIECATDISQVNEAKE